MNQDKKNNNQSPEDTNNSDTKSQEINDNAKSCDCLLNCCEYKTIYQKCNEKLKIYVEDIERLKEKLNDIYSSRSLFEQKTNQNIKIQCASVLLNVTNILNNIINNNQIKDIVQIHESAMFNACVIAVKQIEIMFKQLSVFEIIPKIGELYNPKIHNAVHTTNDKEKENQSITSVIENGAYYKKSGDEIFIVKAAIVIVNIKTS